MMRHRVTSQPDNNTVDDEESSDEDDAFTSLSRKRKGEPKSNDTSSKKKPPLTTEELSSVTELQVQDEILNPIQQQQQPLATLNAKISSTKRHHGEVSDARKAKMDAILLELEAETSKQQQQQPLNTRNRRNTGNNNSHYRNNNNDTEQQQHPYRSGGGGGGGGSFVDPGDEYVTTNIFVGNLATSITEEQMTELFRQFGDLYSVKIMWPRTPEERIRNRHTGFVCFMNRQDAEDAMDACNEQDPFRVGRQLMMRWGKNVRKSDGGGGGPMILRDNHRNLNLPSATRTNVDNQIVATALRSDLYPMIDNAKTIHVVVPKDKERANLISTVASFVAKDGDQFEQLLVQQEGQNPLLTFLSLPTSEANCINYDSAKEEYIYYKWRVYAFCQGDGLASWRTEPFTMLQPNGCVWYPPPLDVDAAQRETEEIQRKEDIVRAFKDERRHQNMKRNIVTGRQLELLRKKGTDGTSSSELSDGDMIEFDTLFLQQLCLSRESICQAMAYCFEKSAAAKQVSLMMQELLLQLTPGISLETLSARLYLISDILYNSQQPGIRNAFLYRDAIQRMAPDVFTYLGDFVRASFGRLSQERVASTVTSVFSAWSKWGVFDPMFINNLSARFEGRAIIDTVVETVAAAEDITSVDEHVDHQITEGSIIDEKPKGDWTSISVHDDAAENDCLSKPIKSHTTQCIIKGDVDDDDDDDDPDGKPFKEENDKTECTEKRHVNEVDPDGEPLEDDPSIDGAPLDDIETALHVFPEEDSIDDEPCEDDVDGVPL